MGVLTRAELERRIDEGELVAPARRLADGSIDLQGDSYDLRAGKVVWKASSRGDGGGQVCSILYEEGVDVERQQKVTVLPGQMIFAVTLEEVIIPDNLCGTVYSRNSLAGQGILALNTGHVDPGYRGQIMIRLINLRASSWTLTLGEQIFTIVFQTLEVHQGDRLVSHPPITKDDMDRRVKRTADESMSNALLDLYSAELKEQLNEHFASVEQRLTKAFVVREDLLTSLLGAVWKWVIGGLLFIATIVGAVVGVLQLV